MIVLHAAPITWDKICGPSTSVPGLVAAQNRLGGVQAGLLLTAANHGKAPDIGLPVFEHKALGDNSGRLDLPAPFDRPHLVVFHSTYIPAHATIARKLRKLAIPYIICPRGGMTSHAQATKRWKKRIGNLLFFNRMVANAAALQCLTQGEAEAISRWNRPVFVLGNGTDFPPRSDLASPGRSARLRLVFLGRLHIDHKGLDMLLEACSLIHDELLGTGAQVELYGPDYRGSTKALARWIARLALEDLVTLNGPVLGREKTSLLKRTDLFLHPSRTEGHPSAVLEALGHGVPCLLTPGTNMAEEVTAAGAGWRVEPSPTAIAEGIKKILSAERNTLQEAGARARELAVRRYSWSQVAGRSVEAYRRYAA